MHYFIIHSGDDYESRVQPLLKQWSQNLNRFKCSVLTSDKEDWHDDARAKIRGAEKVIYIVGEKSATSEHIDWEIKVTFEEKKKIYVYKLSDNYPLNDILISAKEKGQVLSGDKDGELVFTSIKNSVILADDEKMRQVLREDDEYIANHLESSNPDPSIMMKQYEMFVETSEELVRRKQNVNSFYITLNSLIVSIVLAAFTFADKFTLFGVHVKYATIIICLSSLVGSIVSLSWHSLIQSYADLNGSKMKIIAYIETQLAYNLYDTEWQLVAQKNGNKKYKSFSAKEKFIAKLFLILYAVLFFAGVLLSFIK